MFSFFFFFKCPNTTFFNEFLNSPHESATYVHNEFFVIRYSNLLSFVTHVVVFFVVFLRTQSTSCGQGGGLFFRACIRSSLCRCVVCEGLSCACVCVRVWWDVFLDFYMLYRTCPPHGNFTSVVVVGSKAGLGPALVWYLHWGKKKMAAREVEGQGEKKEVHKVKGRVGGGSVGWGGVQVMHL